MPAYFLQVNPLACLVPLAGAPRAELIRNYRFIAIYYWFILKCETCVHPGFPALACARSEGYVKYATVTACRNGPSALSVIDYSSPGNVVLVDFTQGKRIRGLEPLVTLYVICDWIKHGCNNTESGLPIYWGQKTSLSKCDISPSPRG